MNILYEDNHIIAVEKRAKIPTQPAPSFATSLQEEVQAFIKKRDDKKGSVFLHPIHRLDTSAKGIVLFAKSQKALSRLQEEMRTGRIEKEYLALVHENGKNIEKSPPLGILTDFLVHGDHRALIVHEKDPDGKKAELQVVEATRKGSHWLLKIKLLTGRYHQIRAQFSSRGWPILGDMKYQSQSPFREGEIALWHTRIRFLHPTKKEPLEIQYVPEELRA